MGWRGVGAAGDGVGGVGGGPGVGVGVGVGGVGDVTPILQSKFGSWSLGGLEVITVDQASH